MFIMAPPLYIFAFSLWLLLNPIPHGPPVYQISSFSLESVREIWDYEQWVDGSEHLGKMQEDGGMGAGQKAVLLRGRWLFPAEPPAVGWGWSKGHRTPTANSGHGGWSHQEAEPPSPVVIHSHSLSAHWLHAARWAIRHPWEPTGLQSRGTPRTRVILGGGHDFEQFFALPECVRWKARWMVGGIHPEAVLPLWPYCDGWWGPLLHTWESPKPAEDMLALSQAPLKQKDSLGARARGAQGAPAVPALLWRGERGQTSIRHPLSMLLLLVPITRKEKQVFNAHW